jgi:uncharacterized protein (UPF0276 family)
MGQLIWAFLFMEGSMSLLTPSLGFGLGLRTPHIEEIIQTQPKAINWLEIITENYLVSGGKPLYYLNKIREIYPLVMHGVSLSIGSTDPINWEYLNKVKKLKNNIQAKWVSDHLCWGGIQRKNLHDLLPLPYTEEALNHVVTKIKQVQEFLGQRLVIENVSSYISYEHSVLSEWEFLAEITIQADCLLLLDINNIYVSSFNHGFSPDLYLQAIPKDRVQQFHLAGHANFGDHIVDTHDHPIIDSVWDLYEKAVKLFPETSTMIERDAHIPPLADLIAELNFAKSIYTRVRTPDYV